MRLPTVAVPVAVRLASARLPEKRALPWTLRDCVGDEVAIPTRPTGVMRIRSLLLVVNIRSAFAPVAEILKSLFEFPIAPSCVPPRRNLTQFEALASVSSESTVALEFAPAVL